MTNILSELRRELYSDDDPLRYADAAYADTGYPHTNLQPGLVESVLEAVRPDFWLECGTMLGGSAIRTADVIQRLGMATQIVCVDPFVGDVNMWAWERDAKRKGEWQFLRLERGRPTIYDRFLANVAAAGQQDRIIPISATTQIGLKLLRRLAGEGRITSLPSVIYLDSAHEPHETFLEVMGCWALLPEGGILFGDDWGWDAVRNDVTLAAKQLPLNPTRAAQLSERHGRFENLAGVLLDNGQWVLCK